MTRESENLIAQLYDELENGKVYFNKQRLINYEKFRGILDNLSLSVENDSKQSNLIVRERLQILDETKKQSDNILAEAREKARQLVDDHTITIEANKEAESILMDARSEASATVSHATDKANEIIDNANREAADKRKRVAEYISKRLSEADTILSNAQQQSAATNVSLTARLNDIRNLYETISRANSYDFMDENV